jgi:S1-C subfamily serine protease
MSQPHPDRRYALIALLILASGVASWWALTVFNRPAAVGSSVSATGVKGSTTPSRVQATPSLGEPAPPSHSSRPDGGAGTVRGDRLDTSEQDQLQAAKVVRGMSPSPGGGVLVDSTPPGSVAGQLHLQAGDVIVSVNGQPVSSTEEFARIYREQGLPRQLTIMRGGRELHRH